MTPWGWSQGALDPVPIPNVQPTFRSEPFSSKNSRLFVNPEDRFIPEQNGTFGTHWVRTGLWPEG
jgi:hypothetical protein